MKICGVFMREELIKRINLTRADSMTEFIKVINSMKYNWKTLHKCPFESDRTDVVTMRLYIPLLM